MRALRIGIASAFGFAAWTIPAAVQASPPTVTNLGEVAVSATPGFYSVTFRLGSLSCNPEGSGSCSGGASAAYQTGDPATSVEWRHKVGVDGAWVETSKACLGSPAGSLSTWCTGSWTYSTLVVTGLGAGSTVYAQASLKNADGQSAWLNSNGSSGIPASGTAAADTVNAAIWSGNKNPNRQGNTALAGDIVEFKASTLSTAASGVFSKYEWDLDGDGTYEVSTTTNDVHQKTWVEPGSYTVKLRLTSQGRETGTDSRTIEVFKVPPAGEAGVSILGGFSYTNNKTVRLNLVWPEYATEARVSNDGGFASAKTRTVALAESIDWDLDDSIAGVFTKVVYVRFNGARIDTTKTYSDDIILDTTAPTIETSTAAASGSTVALSLKATDDITGVDDVQIKSDTTTVTKDYATSISVPATDLGLVVEASSVSKMAASTIQVRVSDKAGNWTDWKSLSVAGAKAAVTTPSPAAGSPASASGGAATTKPLLAAGSNAKYSSLAAAAKLPVAKGARVSIRVPAASLKVCRPAGGVLIGLKAGTCRVTVTVTPKVGRAKSKTLTLKL